MLVAVLISIAGSIVLAAQPSRSGVSAPRPSAADAGSPSKAADPSSTTAQHPAAPRPRAPAGTLHLASRYLTRYGAAYAGWSDVIAHGKPLPATTRQCSERWRRSGKDPRLSWRSVDYLCLDALGGQGFKPQGIAGSATTRQYSIGARSAAERNIVLTSWYSRRAVPGLFAANRVGESVTRLVVIDLDQRRYNTVELVKPVGPDGLKNLNSHGSGLAWTGQYLYSSSHAKLWMYNVDDLLQISGRYVLPAVTRWTASGAGGFSSMSLDRTSSPGELKTINYSSTEHAYVHSFALADSGLLQGNDVPTAHDLMILNRYGEPGRVVHSSRAMTLKGWHYQGVGVTGRYTFANSSRMRTPRSGSRKVDATAVLQDDQLLGYVQMPAGNGESVYLDGLRQRYWSLVEDGGQFLFAIPVHQLIRTARQR